MTREEADRLVALAQAGGPIPDDVMTIVLAHSGEPVKWDWQDFLDTEDFVDALRKEGLI